MMHPRRRVACAAGAAVALTLAAAGSARADPLFVLADRAWAPGESVLVAGIGFSVAGGFCPAGRVRLEIVRNRRRWDIPDVPSTLIASSTGLLVTSFRVPAGIRPGLARVRATQAEQEIRGTRCSPLRNRTAERRVAIVADERERCPETGCEVLEIRPRIGLTDIENPTQFTGRDAFVVVLPGDVSFAPPTRPCTETSNPPCSDLIPSERRFLPGSRAILHGRDWEVPGKCSDKVSVRLVDAGGDVVPLARDRVDDEGRFHIPFSIPSRGITITRTVDGRRVLENRGATTLQASLDSRDPACLRVAAFDVFIEAPRPRADLLGASGIATQIAPGALQTIRSMLFATDRCDGAPTATLVAPNHKRLLGRLPTTQAWGFGQLQVTVPSDAPLGAAEIVIRQTRRVPEADLGGRPTKSHCTRVKLPDLIVKLAVEIAAPAPSPVPTPAPTPAPQADAVLSLQCPASATAGQTFKVGGALTPARADSQIDVTFTPPSQPVATRKAATRSDGGWDAVGDATEEGTWTVGATFAGDAERKAATANPCTFEVGG